MNTITPASKFLWQVKREYWEHRGGFLWTPLIIALVMLAFMAMGLITAEFTAHQNGFTLNGIHIDQLTSHIDADAMAKFQGALDVGLITMGMPIRIALFVVVFSTRSARCTTTAPTAACCSGSRCRCRTRRRCWPK